MTLPLDHPWPGRPHRVYVALTNACNRECPWCSTCSSPRGTTRLEVSDMGRSFPAEGVFQVQLEGGEPTIHPRFWDFVEAARAHPRCTRVVLGTNGVVLPRGREELEAWVRRLGAPLTVKLSVNHHLLERDAGLLELASLLRDVLRDLAGDRLLVLNVRLRKGRDADVVAAVEAAGLRDHANVFFLQRYGFASEEKDWDPPAPVWSDFRLVNADGRVFGPDLVARSEAMRGLSAKLSPP